MPLINIGGIYYPSLISTNGISFDLFLAGCARKPHCPDCHNPELWDFNVGIRMTIEEITKMIASKKKIDSVAIMGGEPLHNKYLYDLIAALSKLDKSIWLYTSYELSDVPKNILSICDFIKTGKYVAVLHCDSRLKSKNQQIFKNNGDCFVNYYAYDERDEWGSCNTLIKGR